MEIGLITVGSDPDCSDLPSAGTRARLILINYKDVVRIYYSDDGRILAVNLAEGARGYEFLGFRTDVKKRDEVVSSPQTVQRFRHFVSFIVYENTQAQKNNLENLARGRFIAIVENNGKDDDSIELLGRECGLLNYSGQIRNAYENGGFFTINLGTPDNGVEFECKLPQSVGIDYQDGLQIIDDILNPDSITFDSTLYTFDSTEITFDHT